MENIQKLASAKPKRIFIKTTLSTVTQNALLAWLAEYFDGSASTKSVSIVTVAVFLTLDSAFVYILVFVW